MCPHCSARFDMDNNLMDISPKNINIGRAWKKIKKRPRIQFLWA
jgi:hypothetical protein